MKSKNRYISTGFWDDAWVQSLDPSEKFVFLFLLTNPLTNIAGIYEITTRRIVFDTGYNADTIANILKKFEKAGKVFVKDDLIVLVNWPKHQKVSENDNNRKGIDDILMSLDDEKLLFVIRSGYKYPFLNEIIEKRKLDTSPLQAPYKPLIRDSNYLNLNLNSNSNINIRQPSAEALPLSEQKEIQNCQKEIQDEVDDSSLDCMNYAVIDDKKTKRKRASKAGNDIELYNAIKQRFEEVNGSFANYGKEGAAIKKIIYLTKGYEEEIEVMMKKFQELRCAGDKFWQDQPFLPSVLVSLWDRIRFLIRRDDDGLRNFIRLIEEAGQ